MRHQFSSEHHTLILCWPHMWRYGYVKEWLSFSFFSFGKTYDIRAHLMIIAILFPDKEIFCFHSSSSQYFSRLKFHKIFLLKFIFRKVDYSSPWALITLSSIDGTFSPNILFKLAWNFKRRLYHFFFFSSYL